MRAERKKYNDGFKGNVAKFFQMKNSENETFLIEICGGITMYLVSAYILDSYRILQGLFILFASKNNEKLESSISLPLFIVEYQMK